MSICHGKANTETLWDEGEWTIVGRDGQVRSMTPYAVRIYGGHEFAGLCKLAGFSRVDLYGDWEGQPYDDADPDLSSVATK